MDSILDYMGWRNKTTSSPGTVTTKAVRSNQSFPRCSLCKEVLTPQLDPRILNCRHLLCLNCAKEKEYSGIVTCPTEGCLGGTPLDDELGVKGLDRLELGGEESEEQMVPSLSKSFDTISLNASTEDHIIGEDALSFAPKIQEIDFTEANEDDFVVLEGKPTGMTANFYIPFTQKRELCKTLIAHWLSLIWFPPSDLSERKEVIDARPVFVPFYCFTAQTHTTYQVEVGKTVKQVSDTQSLSPSKRSNVEWHTVSGAVSSLYEELVVCGTQSVDTKLATQLLKNHGFSMNTNRVLPPEPPRYKKELLKEEELLSIDIKPEEAYELIGGNTLIENCEQKACSRRITEDHQPEQQRNFTCKTIIQSRKYFVILLPIYLSGFTYDNKTYEVLISGNKGVVEGKRPFGTGLIGKMCMDAFNKVSTIVGESI